MQEYRQQGTVLDLSIVIVHYNTSSDLRTCLESIFANPPRQSFRVTVVDNASTDPGLVAVRAQFTGVNWLLNSQNSGYAKGCNQGMAAHQAHHYLVLNPDIVVLPGALDSLLNFASAHPRAGIIGPQLLNDDGTIQDSCRRFYTLMTLLLRRTFLGKLFPHSGTVRAHLMGDFDHLTSRPVDWVLGGCLLVSQDALARTGPMDERFFLYFEDVDWCYRIWQAGYEVVYSPEARFQHRHRRSSAQGRFNRSFWLHLGSLISFYEKWGLLVWLIKRWRDPLLMLLFWAMDLCGVGLAFGAAYGLRKLGGGVFPQQLFPFGEYLSLLIYALLLSTVVFLGSGRYTYGMLLQRQSGSKDLQRVGIVFMLLLASTYLGHMEVISRAVLLIFLPLLLLAVKTSHRLLLRLMARLERGRLALERTLLVGPFTQIASWMDNQDTGPLGGVDLVGYVSTGNGADGLPPLAAGRVPWLGGSDDLVNVARRYRVSQVVFWDHPEAEPDTLRRWGALRRLGLRLRWQTPAAWLLATGAKAELFGGQLGGIKRTHEVGMPLAIGRRALSFLVGLLLGAISGPLRLWQRLSGGLDNRFVLRKVEIKDPWGFDPELEVMTTLQGMVMPLHHQWGLACALWQGKISVLGTWSLAEGVYWREPGAEGMLKFWGSQPVPCSLVVYNQGENHNKSFASQCRDFWLHPGGLLNLVSPGKNDHDPADSSPSCNEVE